MKDTPKEISKQDADGEKIHTEYLSIKGLLPTYVRTQKLN